MKNLFLAIFIGLLGLSNLVFALGTSVGVIEIPVNPDIVYKSSFRAYTDAEAISIQLQNWNIDYQGNSVSDIKEPFSGTWITIPKTVKKAKKGDNFIDAPYTILIPAEPKKEYMVKLLVGEADISKPNQMSISVGIGIPVYVWPMGLPAAKVSVSDVSYNKGALNAAISNPGPLHVRPSVDVEVFKAVGVWPFQGKESVYSGEFTRYWPVLANAKRLYIKQVSLEKGHYNAVFKSSDGIDGQTEFEFDVVQ